MKLTLEWIQNKAANPAVFSRAQSFYKNNAKIDYYVTYTTPEMAEIMSEVVEGSNTYHVHIQVNEESKTSEDTCDCGGFHTKFGSCKHVIVTLLRVYDDQRRNQVIVRSTLGAETDLMHQLIENYKSQLIKELKPIHTATMTLRPKLSLSSELPQLEVAVGTNRMYVVKDMYKFAHDIISENWAIYGKDLQFKHNLQAFEADSRPLAKLICASIQEYDVYSPATEAPKTSRHIELTPLKLDQFFDLYKDCEVESDGGRELTLKMEDPNLKFELNEEDDIFELTTNLEEFKLLTGQDFSYLVHENSLYRCSDEFVNLQQPIIKTLEESKDFKITIPKEELGKFLSYVPLKEVEIEQEIINTFDKTEIGIKFYLEATQQNLILMRIEFCYDEITINATDENSFKEHPNLLRNIRKETEVTEQILGYGFQKTETNFYELQADEKIFNFLKIGIEELNQLGEIYATEGMKNLKINEPQSFSMGVRLQNNWIHLNFDNIGIEVEDYHHILEAYQEKKNYFRLKDGSFLNLDDPSVQELAHIVEDLNISEDDIEGNEILVPSYRALYLEQFTKLNPEVELHPHTSFEEMIEAFNHIEDADYEVPESLKNILRTYQETGYRWLKTLANFRFGGILADDMGLGKTLQVITLLLSEKNKTSLIVTPSSLMYNWKREIEKFAPQLKAEVVRGEPNHRQLLIEDATNFDVLITSYDLIRRDIEHYEKHSFKYCILDEAHYIKNHSTKNAKAVKKIQSEVHLALTGTPIENSLSDLWSLFDFILPGYLGSYTQFKKRYEIPITKNQDSSLLERIHKQVSPFILRRLKTDVLKELPPKIETNLYCEMDKEQEELYVATLYQMKKSLDKEIKEKGFQQTRMQVLTHLMRLRQLCCHPSLFLENYQGESAKFKMCLELVDDCIASKHKVLIFSQFTSMLDLLAEELKKKDIPYFMLTGSTPADKRLELAEQFNKDETPIFLISLKAGGTGLNLTGADVVIHYDPWWNISAQNQATDRAHRIGQDKTVQVFKLLTKQTIEEKIEELQQRKQDLTEAVIKEGETFITGLKNEEIMALFERDE